MILASAGLALFAYRLSKHNRRPEDDDTDTLPLPVLFGAWQGHELGTTSLVPGQLSKGIDIIAAYPDAIAENGAKSEPEVELDYPGDPSELDKLLSKQPRN